ALARCQVARGPEAFPVIRAALKAKNAEVRESALKAVVEIGPDAREGVAEVVACLKDSAEARRALAAEALGALGKAAQKVAGDLAPLLKDRSPAVRVSAALALWRGGGRG